MKVKELIAKLQKLDGEKEVYKMQYTEDRIISVEEGKIVDSSDNEISVVKLVGWTPF